MKIHIIAIGGRIMHTLALVLKERNFDVSGSDDEIYEPSKSRLEKAGVLPEKMGWDEDRITEDIDLVILGMHARSDNPELKKAQELNLKVVSYPEFIFQESKNKKRVVVAGSHGKTTTTAMIMHVLKYRKIDFDYLIGADLEGFENMVKLSDAPLIIIEGDEYLSSCIDKRSKMMHYHPDISVITGVAWDHVNVFKTEVEYNNLFSDFLEILSEESILFAYDEDKLLKEIIAESNCKSEIENYSTLALSENGNIDYGEEQYQIDVFGGHNRANMMAALKVCRELGIKAPDFFAAIASFKGASKRLELMLESGNNLVYRDFAHAPSKVKATVSAVKEKYPNKHFVALLELHTFSSLNIDFLPHYKGSLGPADDAIVYFSQHTMEIKRIYGLTHNVVIEAFGKKDLVSVSNSEDLKKHISGLRLDNCVVLIMSSGTFDHLDLKTLLAQIL